MCVFVISLCLRSSGLLSLHGVNKPGLVPVSNAEFDLTEIQDPEYPPSTQNSYLGRRPQPLISASELNL